MGYRPDIGVGVYAVDMAMIDIYEMGVFKFNVPEW
jgi:hypothetical protein